MKQIIFFGSSIFSVVVLEQLLAAGCEITNVITTDDKPAGRHLLLTPNPVKLFALEHKLQINKEIISNSVGLVAAYGKIISQVTLDKFNGQIFNIHPSLLPKYRGASPLQQQILDGLTETGVSLIQLDAQMDHGPLISFQKDSILPEDTWITLGNRLFKTGSKIFLTSELTTSIPQDHSQATYTKKLTRQDGFLSWDEFIKFDYKRKYQAYFSWPGIWSIDPAGERVKLASLQPTMVQYPGQKPILWDSDMSSVKI